MIIDNPNVSNKKSNEANIFALNSWANEMVDQIQYLNNQIESLKSQIASLSESEDK